jgi:hypothetical protein
LERAHHGGSGRDRAVVGAQDLASAWPKPHLVKTFKLSRDPNFTEKVEDIASPGSIGRWTDGFQ